MPVNPATKHRTNLVKQAADQRHGVQILATLAWIFLVSALLLCLYQALTAHPLSFSSLLPCLLLVGLCYLLRCLCHALKEHQRLVQLDRAARAGKFSSWAAHQIRSPLTVIRARAQILAQDSLAPSRTQESARHILQSADTISDITTHFLALAHPLRFEPKIVDIEALLHSITASMTASSPAPPRFTLQGRFKPVMGHASLLREAFKNILHNAIESLDKDGLISIHAAPRGRHIQLRITDNGRGIKAGDLRHVAEAGFTTRRDGSGLGLAITRTIIDMHKGQLHIASEERVGTTVTVTLPTES